MRFFSFLFNSCDGVITCHCIRWNLELLQIFVVCDQISRVIFSMMCLPYLGISMQMLFASLKLMSSVFAIPQCFSPPIQRKSRRKNIEFRTQQENESKKPCVFYYYNGMCRWQLLVDRDNVRWYANYEF